MTVEGVGEIYRVDRIEELVIGGDTYRLEVLCCTQNTSLEPGAVEREPFRVRAYQRLEVAVEPHGSPAGTRVAATLWAHLPLSDVHDHGQEDRALEEAHVSLLDEVKRRRHGK